MSQTSPIVEADLHAWVDCVLPASRHAQVQAYLAEHPEQARRLAAYRAYDAAMRRLFEPLLHEPLPGRLRQAARPSAWPAWPQRVAAAVAFAAVGAAAGWTARGGAPDGAVPARLASQPAASAEPAAAADELPRRAALAHAVFSPDARRPVEIGAAQQDQLVAWLSKRLGADIRPPRLVDIGYELVGGRLLPGQRGPVAQFMYQDGAGQRLTLYVSTEDAARRDTGFRFTRQGPINVFYWIDGRFGYALSGGVDRAELARIATEVHRQLPS